MILENEYFDKNCEELKEMINVEKKKYPESIPLFINVNSNIISLEKKRYIVPKDMILKDFLIIVKSKIENLNTNDTIIISVNGDGKMRYIYNENILISNFYEKYKNKKSSHLLIHINRYTTFKWIKSFFI